MREPSPEPEPSLALASGTTSPAPGLAAPRPRLPDALTRPRIRVSPLAGRLALGVIVLATLAVVVCATADPSVLVPRSAFTFPDWEAGPLRVLGLRPTTDPKALGLAFTGVLAIMLVAYGVAVAAVRGLSMRTIAAVVLLLHVILVLSPPLQLTDVFNYLGYARLGALHHLDPYTHTIRRELYDPVFRFSSWHNLRSPYGELFTALTYPLAFLPLAPAYWIVKVVTVGMSLGFVGLVAHCARRLGRDPRFAVAFVALNPIYLIYAIGGFHNDFFMLVASTGAIALVLSGRDRLAGASLMLAVAVKFTAIILGPFLLLACATRPRQKRLIAGGVIAAVPLAAGSLALYGLAIPNLQQQSTLLTDFSIPNLVGLVFGVGGAPWLLKLATAAVVGVVAYQFFYRRGQWLRGAGWATFALIVSLAWAVPWYVVWLLPLAALAGSPGLRRMAVVLTVFLLLAFVPATPMFMQAHGIRLLDTPAGHASRTLQNKLAH